MNHTQETKGHVTRFGAQRTIKTVPKPLITALALLAAVVTASNTRYAALLATLVLALTLATNATASTHPVCDKQMWKGASSQTIDQLIEDTDLETLIDRKICTLNTETPFHVAAKYASMPALKTIIELTSDIDQTARDDCTALCRAIFWNRPQTAIMLIEHGAKPNLRTPSGSPIERSLMYAPANFLEPVLSHLQETGFVFDEGHIAAAIRNTDANMTGALLKIGMDPETIIDMDTREPNSSWSALEYALIYAGSPDTITLLADAGARLNFTGQTKALEPVPLAVLPYLRNFHMDNLKALIKQKQDMLRDAGLQPLFCGAEISTRACLASPSQNWPNHNNDQNGIHAFINTIQLDFTTIPAIRELLNRSMELTMERGLIHG